MKGFEFTWEPARLRMIRLQRSENGPYVTALTVHIPDMRVETVKICPHSLPYLSNRCVAIEHLSPTGF
jgi:hypothetical protein